MAQYIVIWRGSEDDFMVTDVELGDVVDARQMSTNEWADLAWSVEYAEFEADERGPRPSESGYDLICVLRGPVEFVY